MEAMPRPRPPHLHRETNRHGKTVWYVRIGKGRRVRINATYGSPEFDDAYQAALSDQKPRPADKAARGTLGVAVDALPGSTAWLDLSMATRKQRENIMVHVLNSGGTEPPFSGSTGEQFKRAANVARPHLRRPRTSSARCAGFSIGRLTPTS